MSLIKDQSILPWGLHWFRRDLRLEDNKAFIQQLQRWEGRVLGFFCFDRTFLERPDFSHHRFHFFLQTLQELKKDLHSKGSDLWVLDLAPQKAFPFLFRYHRPHHISFNEDYEPYARQRDGEMVKIFQQHKVSFSQHKDHLFFSPHDIYREEGTQKNFYKVYTAFAKKWMSQFETLDIKDLKKEKSSLSSITSPYQLSWSDLFPQGLPHQDQLDTFTKHNQSFVKINIPSAGHQAALLQIKNFQKKIIDYHLKRDIPSLAATSGFSIFLKNGTLTVPMIIKYLKLASYAKEDNGYHVFFKELIWREFFYHILFHRPRVELESFQAHYIHLKWGNREDWFTAWMNGKTGFPIVDAGIRELRHTGLMHNRVRMIVACFLVKDLLIDWRWGERFFMEQLLDGDLAVNNGNWQWCASTGVDAQPYFRIFNPWTQSLRFDPDGLYIKKWIPELKDVPAKYLHKLENLQKHKPLHYPSPIIQHEEQRKKILKIFEQKRRS